MGSPSPRMNQSDRMCYGQRHRWRFMKLSNFQGAKFDEFLKELNGRIIHGRKVVLLYCGDLSFLASIFGLAGCSAAHPCVYCHSAKEVTDARRRSLNSIADNNQVITSNQNRMWATIVDSYIICYFTTHRRIILVTYPRLFLSIQSTYRIY